VLNLIRGSKYVNDMMKSISGGDFHTIGLKSDGTVVAVGHNVYNQTNVSEWNSIGRGDDKLTLSDRTYECECDCGYRDDRDINNAINFSNYIH